MKKEKKKKKKTKLNESELTNKEEQEENRDGLNNFITIRVFSIVFVKLLFC